MLKASKVEELRSILKKNYGLDLSFNEAQELGRNLLNFYGSLLDLSQMSLPKKTDR